MTTKPLTLISRKMNLYNKLSREIEVLKIQLRTSSVPAARKYFAKQIRLHRETQKLLDDIFNGEIEV